MRKSRRAGLLASVCSAGALAAFLVASAPASAETLADAIALAYQTNPTLQAQRAQLRATDENYVQARAGLRPTAKVTADYNYQNSESLVQNDPVTGKQVVGPEARSTDATLSITQTLYSGGALGAGIRAAEADVLSGREQLRQVESTVLQNVVSAYVSVRRDQQALGISQENVNVLKRQLEESKARFEVGEITRTDVAQSEARLAAAQASLSSAQAQLAISRSTYAAVVGQNPGDLAAEPDLGHVLPATVEQAFETAEKRNPSILSADYAEQAAAARVAAAKAQTRPTVSVRGGFGYAGADSFGRSEWADQRNITGVVTASVPLFTGGLYSSQIRQAAERDNAARIGLEGAKRQTVQQVSQAWNQLLAARANLISNEQQVKATEIAYEGTRQENQVGLRTTLDVLNAEQELRNAQLALVNARHDAYVAAAAVLSAMGSLEARYLAADAPLYDPAKSFNKVQRSGAVPWEGAVQALDSVGAPAIRARPTGVDQPIPTAKAPQ